MVSTAQTSKQFLLPKTISFEKLSVSLHLIQFILSVVVILLMYVQGCLEILYFPVYIIRMVYKSTLANLATDI